MGFVRATGLLGATRERAQEVTFLVDSGSFYTVLSPEMAHRLGITTTLTTSAVLADKREVEMPLGVAYLHLLDREGGIPVGVLDVPEPLLGATALECLGLKVDPSSRTLEYSRPYGPALL